MKYQVSAYTTHFSAEKKLQTVVETPLDLDDSHSPLNGKELLQKAGDAGYIKVTTTHDPGEKWINWQPPATSRIFVTPVVLNRENLQSSNVQNVYQQMRENLLPTLISEKPEKEKLEQVEGFMGNTLNWMQEEGYEIVFLARDGKLAVPKMQDQVLTKAGDLLGFKH